ncbi:hypothetical protein J3R82DRAFT_4457 [Butyriboletus roseoflavus]|nr:hypothetical protein J3R82DRAFT_4457 [Butyriboletus roseoflavus]
MPRLLPRLLKALQETPLTHSNSKRVARSQDVGSRKSKSLYRPVTVSLPSFHPAGRTRSILLDENPVTDKRVFARHKRLPPRVHLGPRPVVHGEHDVPREMTTKEREWWSSPYLRMLATPLRQCTISKRYLPNDFLVRLAVLRLPTTQNARMTEVLMPDGLEHPKYKRRKARVTVYVPCWKDAVETMRSPGDYLNTSLTRQLTCVPPSPVSLPHHSADIFFSKHLCSHTSYLLRLRVLQELEVLIDALKQNRGRIEFDAHADPTILRRLTRSEFKTFRGTGIVPYPGAVAILVVPPVNRDPKTKLRPRPSQEPEIPSGESSALPDPVHKKALPPLSSLHYVSVPEGVFEQGLDHPPEVPFSTFLPNARVPLYNGVTMFPSPPHRAALHNSLTELLDVERHFRGAHLSSEMRTTSREDFQRTKGDAKASHAFLLLSNEQTVRRADTAALAIALWRLRMWEGDTYADKFGGWEVGKEWRIEQNNRL